jgi:hypothetical protein
VLANADRPPLASWTSRVTLGADGRTAGHGERKWARAVCYAVDQRCAQPHAGVKNRGGGTKSRSGLPVTLGADGRTAVGDS